MFVSIGAGGQSVRATFFGSFTGFAISLLIFALPAGAQQGQGHNGFGVHAPPPSPSVTSIGGFGPHAPNPLPSVTSIPNDNFRFNNGARPFFNGNGHRGRRNFGYPLYTTPYYYYPLDSSGYGYDYVGNGGPDLYSGPPPGPNEPILHVIVEQPPVGAYGAPRQQPREEAAEPPQSHPSVEALDVKPGEPTVIVFRNGKHEEVTNYAIMGETLYVFDQGRKKIALADLDLAATVKANDDRGMEFRVPAGLKKKAAPAPQSATPDAASETPRKIATLNVDAVSN